MPLLRRIARAGPPTELALPTRSTDRFADAHTRGGALLQWSVGTIDKAMGRYRTDEVLTDTCTQ
jgi:hypothetical protein